MDGEVVKVIIIGDSLVGKTSFIHRYVNNTFRTEYKSTIGVDFALKIVRWNDKTIKLQLWDIAGQERFTFMTRAYYKDSKGCILMFDINNARSFEKIVKWKTDLDSKARSSNGAVIPCLLVANKTDLAEPEVTLQQIADMCTEHQFIGWTETSVKNNVMVGEAVTYLLDVIKGKCPRVPPPRQENFLDSISLRTYEKKKTSCNC